MVQQQRVFRAAGDWLQGPYVYALYQHYGYEVGDIGRLFIAGFGSSMVFGTIAGSMADQQYACQLPVTLWTLFVEELWARIP
jgi:hypothetical protein